jgi:hypothetical protein
MLASRRIGNAVSAWWWNQSNAYKKSQFSFFILAPWVKYIILNFDSYDSRYVSPPEIEKETLGIFPSGVRTFQQLMREGNFNPILHTAWLNNHALTLKRNTAN